MGISILLPAATVRGIHSSGAEMRITRTQSSEVKDKGHNQPAAPPNASMPKVIVIRKPLLPVILMAPFFVKTSL